MTTAVHQCANCGAPLASADAICARCDQALAEVDYGPHVCPACGRSFDEPPKRPYPPGRPWYLPQTLVPNCPHCFAWLQDDRVFVWPDWRLIAYYPMTILAALIPESFRMKMLAISTVFVVFTVIQIVRGRRIPERTRYVLRRDQPKVESS